jgi:CheY-like chemotaxis protein
MDTITKLIDSIVSLLGVLIWPLVWIFLVLYFGSTIKQFILGLGEFSLKSGIVEASLKQKQLEVAASISAATISHGNMQLDSEKVANRVTQVIKPETFRKIASSRVLWVDDIPENNVYERKSLELLGVLVYLSLSTEEALHLSTQIAFDLIISDMARVDDDRAGYTLLEKLRQEANSTPFLIYSSSREEEHLAEARRRGAIGCTNQPEELFSIALSVLIGR